VKTRSRGLGSSIAERPTAVGYVRVSTDEQARDGVSLEAQQARIRAYAEAKGLALGDVLSDEGYTGKNLKRPALQELLARCDRREVGAVIVLKLDRLTRRTRHLLSIVEDVFLARHIELHSVSESLDTSTPHGRFVLTLFGGLAQMERELIAERTRAALAYKREQRQPTSHPPLGFRANGKRCQMEPVPEELEVVRQILTLWRHGHSYASIARKLNAEGTPTKRAGRWYHSTVGKVVQRREQYGRVQVDSVFRQSLNDFAEQSIEGAGVLHHHEVSHS
jgi:DNA invertase Pin-like site-specific DNA recombinase